MQHVTDQQLSAGRTCQRPFAILPSAWEKHIGQVDFDTVRNYAGTIIKDNLDNVAPEFRVFLMCQAFDKEFSLCANLPKVIRFTFLSMNRTKA